MERNVETVKLRTEARGMVSLILYPCAMSQFVIFLAFA